MSLSKPTAVPDRYRLGWALIVLVCVVIMLPRLASPQFGLFDDGTTIETARQILHGGWNMSFDIATGRFRPVYWLYYALIYGIAGANPLAFFLGNTLLLILTPLAAVWLVRSWGGSPRQALFTGLLFAISGPVIENYYTLSKAEPLQLLLVLAGLIVLRPLSRVSNLLQRSARVLGATLLFLSAMTSKETALVLVPVAVGWIFLAWMGKHRKGTAAEWPFLWGMLLAAGVSAAAWYGLRVAFGIHSLSTGSYSGRYVFTVGGVLASIVRWGGWIIRDYPHLFLLALLLVIAFAARRRVAQSGLLFGALIWMVGWLVVFMPWIFTVEYYMLAFAAGAAVIGGLALDELLVALPAAVRWVKAVGFACLALAGVFLLGTIANNATNANIQLTVDRANAAMLDYLAANLPAGSQVLVNIQDPNEYVVEIGLHLAVLHDRPDISLTAYQGKALPARAYVILPTIQNQIRMSVRMGVNEPTQDGWNQSLQEALQATGAALLHTDSYQFHLFNLDLPQLFCPFIQGRSYCAAPAPTLDRRTFAYGWETYQIQGK
ncbi:MAG: hypothetical protein M1281_03570 [Chloroflexi bacterium]|nr:hypothetical protein [Chloroflexota bacterium]